MRVGYQSTQRFQSALLRLTGLHQHHCRCGIVDTRGVPRGHAPITFEGRTQFRQPFQSCVCPDVLISVKDHGLSFDLGFNRQDLLLEVAGLDRCCRFWFDSCSLCISQACHNPIL